MNRNRVIAVGVVLSVIIATASWLAGVKTRLGVEPIISTFALITGLVGTVIAASNLGDEEANGNSIELDELLTRKPSTLAERGFLDGMSVFDESKPSYGSFVGLYALVHDPYDAENRTALEKQIELAEDVIASELEVQNKNKLRVLDIGCGTGELVRFLEEQEEVEEVVGLDRSEGMKHAAKDYTRVDSKIVNDDVRYLSEIERSDFDVVFMFRTFTYMYEDWEVSKALKNISNVLSRGGLLVFDCVDKNKLWEDGYIPEDRNYALDEPADLSVLREAPNIEVDYEGQYNSENFDKGQYIYEANYSIKPLGGENSRSQSKFEIFEREHLRAMTRDEVESYMPPTFEIDRDQPNFNPNEDTPAMNFLNFLRKI
ncbi:hypothetical protein GCM10009647_046960 [Streptomyces sanglieri]